MFSRFRLIWNNAVSEKIPSYFNSMAITPKKYFYSENVDTKTVFALSSGAGKCGVAVIRVTGPHTKQALKLLCGKVTMPRMASVCKLLHPQSKEVLDNALVLWFPGNIYNFIIFFCNEYLYLILYVYT